MVAACMVLDPHEPLLDSCVDPVPHAVVDNHLLGYGAQLDSNLLDQATYPRKLMVFRQSGALKHHPIFYNRNRVRLGPTAIYRVTHTILHNGVHYALWRNGAAIVNSHPLTQMHAPEQLDNEGRMLDGASSHLFLERIAQ